MSSSQKLSPHTRVDMTGQGKWPWGVLPQHASQGRTRHTYFTPATMQGSGCMPTTLLSAAGPARLPGHLLTNRLLDSQHLMCWVMHAKPKSALVEHEASRCPPPTQLSTSRLGIAAYAKNTKSTTHANMHSLTHYSHTLHTLLTRPPSQAHLSPSHMRRTH